MHVSPVEYVVIGAYLGMMILIGIVFRHFSRNADNYFRSGTQGTWWLVGSSVFMSSISALTFTGNGGMAFVAGWSIIIVYLANVTGFALHALFLAAWYRQMRAVTFPEVIAERFGQVTRQVYAYLSVVLFLCQAAVWLLGLAIYSAVALGLSLWVTIPTLGLVVLFYASSGGKWAVLAADFVQGAILMLMTVVLSILCIRHFGGVGELLAAIQDRGLSDEFAMLKPSTDAMNDPYNWTWVLGVFVIQVVSIAALPQGAKYFAVKDGREARKAAVLVMVLMAGGALLWFIPPITARLLYEQEVLASGMPNAADAAFAVVSGHFLPTGLVGMMIVAMFAATMSSMDAGLNGNAAVFVRDILPALCRRLGWPQPNGEEQLRLGRLITVACGLAVIVLALLLAQVRGHGLFEIALRVAALLVLPMCVPLVLGLFARRSPWFACLVSVGCGFLPSVVALVGGYGLSIQAQAFWVCGCGVLGFWGSYLVPRRLEPIHEARVASFFAQMQRPVDFAREVGAGNDSTQLSVLGRFALGCGVFVALLLLVPNPLFGRALIACCAAMLAALGSLMLWRARVHRADRDRTM